VMSVTIPPQFGALGTASTLKRAGYEPAVPRSPG
jgi:hypothetical protein